METLQDPTSQPLPVSTSAEGASRTQSSQREGGSSWRRRRHSCTAVAISQPLSVRRETSSQPLPVSCFVDGGSYSPQRVLPAHSQRDSDNTADGPRGVPSNGDLFSTSDASGAVSEVRNDVRTATPSSTPSLFSPNESLQDSLTCSNDGVPASRHFSDSNSNLTSTAATQHDVIPSVSSRVALVHDGAPGAAFDTHGRRRAREHGHGSHGRDNRDCGGDFRTASGGFVEFGGAEAPTSALPDFAQLQRGDSENFSWGNLDGPCFVHVITAAYAEIVHWRRNIFLVPSGRAGKSFVSELTKLIAAYANASALEGIALKAAMVMQTLLLQKPFSSAKARDHAECLERRLNAWRQGDVDGLIREGRTIQAHLQKPRRDTSEASITRAFTHLMMVGRVKAALRLVTERAGGGVLHLDQKIGDQTVRDVLKSKHPPGVGVADSALVSLSDGYPIHHSVLFARLTGATIRSAALRTEGSAGPSGVDAAGWRRLCTAFHGASKGLCDAVAALARRICTSYVDPSALEAYVACRLIPLDKCPGVRPIGVAESLRRIVGKAIMAVAGHDVQQAAGPLQLCAGQPAGCEAAVHVMRQLFTDPDCEAVLLVDASNAFNCLNRQVALRNILVLCPALAPVLVNTYRSDIPLFVGGEVLLSREGTTQGDPLAMAMYAIATIPLIRHTQQPLCTQAWFADDATAGGRLTALKSWWDNLLLHGPSFGYFPNSVKTWLVVKVEHLSSAAEIFSSSGIQISTEGRRHLGGALGFGSFTEEFVKVKVKKWVADVERLSLVAQNQPHCAYAAFCHGLLGRWIYLSRIVPDIADLLQPIDSAIQQRFIPALTGRPEPGLLERQLLALPTRLGGLGLSIPSVVAPEQHAASLRITAPLAALIAQQEYCLGDATDEQLVIKGTIHRERQSAHHVESARLREQLSPSLQHCLSLAQEKGASNWLSALPLEQHGFHLSKSEFRDALCLRYDWPIAHLPTDCVCGQSFSAAHALSCPTGGFPTVRHNEVRDVLAKLLSEVSPDVCSEPVLQPLTGEHFRRRTTNTDDHARLDIRARGFWGGRFEVAFFDVRIFNPTAPSNRSRPLPSVYRSQERQKINLYEERVREVERGSFTPLVFSTTGGVSKLTSVFLRTLASKLAEKRDVPYSTLICWLRTVLNFSLLRAAVMCLRGSRSSSRRLVCETEHLPLLAVSEAHLQSV